MNKELRGEEAKYGELLTERVVDITYAHLGRGVFHFEGEEGPVGFAEVFARFALEVGEDDDEETGEAKEAYNDALMDYLAGMGWDVAV